jgi:hypothetical protein
VPQFLSIPGFVSARRYRLEPAVTRSLPASA